MTQEGTNGPLIRAGAEAVARWRKENVGLTINAAHVTLNDLDLSGADLSDADLAEGRFTRCNLKHVSFRGARLNGAVFTTCCLDDTDFTGADITKAELAATSLDGARFGASPSLGRIRKLEISSSPLRPIHVDRTRLPWFDRFLAWERLRFLATIKIFVPAYTSLTLTVLYLNGIAWYNSIIDVLNGQLRRISAHPSVSALPLATPSWTQVLILINFACLAAAATAFLACPARVTEFSREKWISELGKPEILYDVATWTRPVVRVFCAGMLLIGGAISAFLLGKAVLHQASFILSHVQ